MHTYRPDVCTVRLLVQSWMFIKIHKMQKWIITVRLMQNNWLYFTHMMIMTGRG